MRIVATADIHFGSSNHLGRINPETGLHTRLEDFLHNFDTIVDYVLDNDIDLFVIAGDLYKTRSPSNTEQEEFAKRIARLGSAGQRTLILTGNHDMWASKGSAHTIAVINALRPKSVTIIDSVDVVEIDGVKIGAIPYLYRQRLGMKTNEEVVEFYQATCDSFREQGVKILIGHQSVEGAKMPSGYAAAEQMTEIVVPKKCFKGFDLCLFGHIHEYQVMNRSDPLCLYTGPLERIDFSQSDKKVGFIIYDTETKIHQFEELNAADLYYIRVDVRDGKGNITQRVIDQIDQERLKDSIATISIQIRETDITQLNRSEIEKLLNTTRFSAGLRLEIERSKVSRDQQVNETISAADALQRYIKGRSDISDIADELLKRGTEIIKIYE